MPVLHMSDTLCPLLYCSNIKTKLQENTYLIKVINVVHVLAVHQESQLGILVSWQQGVTVIPYCT